MESWICRFKDDLLYKCSGGSNGLGHMAYCSLGYAILTQNIASSCFNLGVKTETDSSIEMLCIS